MLPPFVKPACRRAGEIEGDYKIAFSFPNLKEGLTARMRIPPKIQKMAAR